MELLPGHLLLLLAALLPLAARSGPALHTAGREEPGTAKPGYCYHIPEVEDPLHEDCAICRRDASCSRCTSDAGCPGATKCCPSKCGYTCQEPVLDFCYLPSVCGSCKALFRRFFFNASSQQCEEFIYGGCGGNRNNFETKGECFRACSHIGLYDCPPPGRIPLKACDNFCSSDKDCPGDERCCSTGCGRECRLPVGVKRGFCPRPDPDVVTICLVACRSDSECRGSEKCCSQGCLIDCTAPVPPKPGVCPKRRVLQTFAPCNSSCSIDTDCPRHEKCCFTGCGLGCLPPDRGAVAPLLPTAWGHGLGPAASSSLVSAGDVCDLPPVPGPCRGRFHHYAYNPAMGTCQPFTYSGCGGNPNNFKTVKECQQVCQKPGRAQE